jgi:hypothetical protein
MLWRGLLWSRKAHLDDDSFWRQRRLYSRPAHCFASTNFLDINAISTHRAEKYFKAIQPQAFQP